MKLSGNRVMILVLGMMAATGPMAIDMYLPTIPSMAQTLSASEGAVQLTLMTFFIGLTFGQLVYGPLSDKYGRKSVAYLGLSIFVAGSVGCALTDTITQLQWLRFIQGIGASIGFVMAFAIVKDRYRGAEVGKMMSMIMAVLGITPVLAPIVGDFLNSLGSWRTIFWVMMLYGIVLALLVAALLPETRSEAARQAFKLGRTFHSYGRIFVDRRFIPFSLALCTAQAGFFAYLAGSASVFISEFDLTPTQFSLVFAANAIGLMIAALVNPKLHERFGPLNTFRGMTTTYCVILTLLTLYLLLGGNSVIVWGGGLFFAIMTMGFIAPTGSQLTLLQQGQYAGTASALMGSMQFGAAAVVAGISGALAHFGGLGLTAIMLACALTALIICFTWFPKKLTVPV